MASPKRKLNKTSTKKKESTVNSVRTFLGMSKLPEASAKSKKARNIGFLGSKKK